MRAAGRISLAVGAAAWLAAAPALAQVTTNSNALDALGKPEPTHRAPPRRPAHPAPAPRKPAAEAKPTAAPPTPTPAPAKLPTVPATPPAILALPPPVVVPLAHPPPAPTIPMADDAPGQATPIQGGVRVTFGTDRADLNPASVAALRDFARAQLDKTQIAINIFAYAAGSPDDPSAPRRLSLQRALAARAVLMEAGIPSPRIYPRALGPEGGDAAPDRVDVVTGTSTPPVAPSHAG